VSYTVSLVKSNGDVAESATVESEADVVNAISGWLAGTLDVEHSILVERIDPRVTVERSVTVERIVLHDCESCGKPVDECEAEKDAIQEQNERG